LLDIRIAPPQKVVTMTLYLQVEYKDRKIAKQSGAKWDPMRREWYIDDRDLRRYSRAFRMRQNEALKKRKVKWKQLELNL
jgi:hypothetical protein